MRSVLTHMDAMQRTQSPMIVLAVCLAALAGFVDALVYSSLGGFFAAFMSGNTTRLGISLAAGRYDEVRMAGALILSFVSGAMIAAVIARHWPQRAQTMAMIGVTLLIGFAAMLAQHQPDTRTLLLLAGAMGLENGGFARGGEIGVGLARVTGLLVRMGEGLAGALMGDADRWGWLRHLLLWLGFLCGVVMGARCYGAFDSEALWLAAGAAGALAISIAALSRAGAQTGPWGPRPA